MLAEAQTADRLGDQKSLTFLRGGVRLVDVSMSAAWGSIASLADVTRAYARTSLYVPGSPKRAARKPPPRSGHDAHEQLAYTGQDEEGSCCDNQSPRTPQSVHAERRREYRDRGARAQYNQVHCPGAHILHCFTRQEFVAGDCA